MACCNNNITSFSLVSSNTIAYTGDKPTVSVIYLQPDGTFLQSGVFTQIIYTTTDVIIYHGGPASGVIKLIQ